MDFQLNRHHGPDGDTISFKGEIRIRDIALLNLTPLDRALLNDVGGDPAATAADTLLVLEMLYRRHQEQTKPTADPVTEKEE